jgi:hypothetical protein
MPGVPQSPDQLRAQLKDQLAFIARSANAFDAGATEEAKRIATAVRVLVHDTKASISLLRQLSLKETAFRDTAVPYNPANIIGSQSLVRMRLTIHTDSGGWAFRSSAGRRLSRHAVMIVDERVRNVPWWFGLAREC